MSDEDDEQVQPASTGIPIVTGTDGQPYIAATAVVAILRAIANSCRNLADNPEVPAEDHSEVIAAAIDIEADNLDTRAIAATIHTCQPPA